MKRDDIDNAEISWIEEIKQNYNVSHEDFTQHHPEGILVYRGSSQVPNIVFNEGFQRSKEPIWIEDSRYLLKGIWHARHYTREQMKLNRTLVTDQEFGHIVPPGANRGLVSTTLSPKKAARYTVQSFLEKAKEKANQNYSDVPDNLSLKLQMKMDYLGGYLARTAEVNVPIGYIYAVRIKHAINISSNFQWDGIADSDFIEQEMACSDIPASDVVYMRPVFMTYIPGKAYVCTVGNLSHNPSFSQELSHNSFPFLSDNALDHFKTLLELGRIEFSSNLGFIFTYNQTETLSLDDSEFSKQFIKPTIAPDRKTYLENLKSRIQFVEELPDKKSKTDDEDHKFANWGFNSGFNF